MLTAALFVIIPNGKQPKCPSVDEQMHQSWHVLPTEYYSAVKKNERLTLAATWMNLKIITLREKKPDRKEHTLHNFIYINL